jgi:hypothetical protein
MRSYPVPAFANSRTAFEGAVTALSAEGAAALDHAELERRVEAHGRELMRCLAQDHLDLRSMREKEARPEAVQGADGVERTEVRPSSRRLGMLFGMVEVNRLAFVRHGAEGGLRPLDAHLNLPAGLYSQGVQREIVWGVAQGSYDAVVDNLRRTTGATIAKRQAEDLVMSVAADFEDYYLEQPPQADPRGHLLVLTFDGSGVVMRPDGLRPETRKRAEKAERKTSVAESAASGRRRDDERRNRKRMAEVAAVYSLAPVSRTPEDVLRELRRTGPHEPRPKAQNKRVWASLERSIVQVVDEAFYEAMQRDETNQRRWVAVVDGNQDQLAAIHRMAWNCDVAVTVVIDFIHVLGYLWKAGKALNGNDATATEAWVSERADSILRGQPSQVAAGMRRSATLRGLSGKARKPVDECANYLLNHREYLRYHEYLRDGLPIATGVIEGACRSVVQDRMDITGARWGLRGGEAVLKLRSLRASGDLQDYLAFHARRELERNHLSHYDEHELLDLREAA